MATVASPYGLKPVNLIGGQSFTGGTTREYKVSTDTTAFFLGDVIALTTAGLPQRVTTTPTAIKIPATAADATAGIMGVCAGVRYVNPSTRQSLWGQYIQANAVTAGFTDIFVSVWDDPDQLYQIQGSAGFGTFNSGTAGSGWPGAIGKNAALGNLTAPTNTVPGLSAVNLIVGTNGASLATTSTLAMRIVDVVRGTELDAFPELIVKFNVGVHSYNNSLGI